MFLWGSWIPSAGNDDKQVEVYFYVIAKQEDYNSRFVFFFHLVAKDENLEVRISLDSMHSLTNTEYKSFKGTLTLINSSCSEKSSVRDKFIIRGNELTHKGNGNLRMIFLVERSEENEVQNFIKNKNSSRQTEAASAEFSKKLKCSKEKLEFFTKSSEVSGAGLKVLI